MMMRHVVAANVRTLSSTNGGRARLLVSRSLGSSSRKSTTREPKVSSSAPFASHQASATVRHREKQQLPKRTAEELPKPRKVVGSRVRRANVGQTTPNGPESRLRKLPDGFPASATARRQGALDQPDMKKLVALGGRISRHSPPAENTSGGSVAASMSATVRHRHQRQTMEKTPSASKTVANPSNLSIPLSETQKEVLSAAEGAAEKLGNAGAMGTDNEGTSNVFTFTAGFILMGGAAGVFYLGKSSAKVTEKE